MVIPSQGSTVAATPCPSQTPFRDLSPEYIAEDLGGVPVAVDLVRVLAPGSRAPHRSTEVAGDCWHIPGHSVRARGLVCLGRTGDPGRGVASVSLQPD